LPEQADKNPDVQLRLKPSEEGGDKFRH
jgi:hypothetical protein